MTKVIVIGAGRMVWSRCGENHSYLRINPRIHLGILDNGDSVGGVWSASRVYPGLVVDSPAGFFEYSDMPMFEGDQQQKTQIDALEVTAYLERYALKHDLLRRIHFKTHVSRVTRHNGGWVVISSNGEEFECDKLIVSTGLASMPKEPKFPNVNDGFKGPIIHTASMGKEHHRLTDHSVRSVAVVGGCKSAIEAAMLCVGAGKFVHWLVRPNGSGPGFMLVTNKDRPSIVAINSTRIFNTLSPSIFVTSGFWYSLYHSGKFRFGRLLNRLYWKQATKFVLDGPNYRKSVNGGRLRPISDNVFWIPHCLSLIDEKSSILTWMHDPSKILVHRSEATHLSSSGIHLSTHDTPLPVDALVLATGWEKSPSFFPEATALQLGLPVPTFQEPADVAAEWALLATAADTHITSKFPNLSFPPPCHSQPPQKTPYRLYRHIIPPHVADHTIAFTGHLITSQTVLYAELSALYAVAHLEDILPTPLPDLSAMKRDIALMNAWMSRRYGEKGIDEPLNLSEIPLFDLMCTELGLNPQRKKSRAGVLAEWLLPHRPRDYRGLVDEFLDSKNEKMPTRPRPAIPAEGKQPIERQLSI